MGKCLVETFGYEPRQCNCPKHIEAYKEATATRVESWEKIFALANELTAGLPPVTDAEIDAELEAYRAEKRAKREQR